MEEVQERNTRERNEDGTFDSSGKGGKGKGKGYPSQNDEESSNDEEPDQEKKAPAKKTGVGGSETNNPNAKVRNEEVEGVELSRKQREELDKQASRRRYEELHKAGKTDEAKADLARLEEVKKRRAEAATKRAEDEAKAKEAEAEKAKITRGGMTKEVKEALGGEAARTGSRSSMKASERVKNDVNLYSYVDGAGEKPKEEPTVKPADYTIQSCRAAEDDFM